MYTLEMNHLHACAGCLLGSQEETLNVSGWIRTVWLWEGLLSSMVQYILVYHHEYIFS